MGGNSGQIKKGEVRNPKGRPTGAVNKATKTTKDTLAGIMKGEFDNGRIEQALEETFGKDKHLYLNVLAKFLPYIMPKQTQSEVNVSSSDFSITDVIKIDAPNSKGGEG